MLTIPLTNTPSQSLSIILNDQTCRINVYQKNDDVFLDLFVSDVPIVQTVICRDRIRIVRYEYLGFIGDLAFMDTHGTSNPNFSEFGTRFKLVYIS